jgi:methyltransferase family protein
VNIDDIETGRQQVIDQHGAWTAHNIHLGGGRYTIGERIVGDEAKLRRIVQVVADTIGRPFPELRVLDLACLEGMYAIEFARHGASVLGIEGRATNLEKARFVKQVLGLDALELVQDDVRNLDVGIHGSFDVVLCLGILYHLDAPDVFSFLERIADVCTGIAVFDTHVSLSGERSVEFGDRVHRGEDVPEHTPESTAAERAGSLWASLDNVTSFWLTRASLCNALMAAGFTSIFECHVPAEPDKVADRVTLVAIKGRRQELMSSPLMAAHPWADVPEPAAAIVADARWADRVKSRLASLLGRR